MKIFCFECKKIFKTLENLVLHNKNNPNCTNRCNNCYKYFLTPEDLQKHKNFTVCKRVYRCHKCLTILDNYLKKHNDNIKKHNKNVNIIFLLMNVLIFNVE